MELTTEHVWTLLRDDLAAHFRRRVADEHLAEDLVQETFVRVHDRLGSLEQADRMAAWVWRIAGNVLTDHYRRRGSPGLEQAAEHTEAPIEELAIEPEPTSNLSATAGGWARAMIVLLPEPYREALALSELEGLTQQQVADRLGLSLSGTKSRIQRGRVKLRELLLDCCHLDFDDHGDVVDYVERNCCSGDSDC